MWLFRAHFSVKLLSHKWHVNFLHEEERKPCKRDLHRPPKAPAAACSSPEWGSAGSGRTAGRACHVCITRHWFCCPGLALQPFILCFAVGPNGFEKFCYSPVTPEANVRIDFTCTGLHHLSRAWAVRAEAKWKAIHTKLLRQPLLSAGGGGFCWLRGSPHCSWNSSAPAGTQLPPPQSSQGKEVPKAAAEKLSF